MTKTIKCTECGSTEWQIHDSRCSANEKDLSHLENLTEEQARFLLLNPMPEGWKSPVMNLEDDIKRVRAQIEWQRDYGSDAREEMIETLNSFERIVNAYRSAEYQSRVKY